MVDWQGRILTVNSRENAELLDASCGGGGGNFGECGLTGDDGQEREWQWLDTDLITATANQQINL